MSYYAVAKGRIPGIYSTWSEAEAQVKGFPNAKHKKFNDVTSAEMFLKEKNGSRTVGRTPVVVRPNAMNFASQATITGKKRPLEIAGKSEDTTMLLKAAAKKIRLSSDNLSYLTNPTTTFYAVAAGVAPGIYTSWREVQQQTESYTRPVYRKFATREEAHEFLTSYQKARISSSSVIVDDGKSITAFYAVAKGRKTGIFTTWAEAFKQVDGLHSAAFKKFSTQSEAEAFIQKYHNTRSSQKNDPDPEDPTTLVAFCDGSAIGNGKVNCKAGYACIFPHNTSWNVSSKLVDQLATNNRAEYLAALEAMKRANQEDPTGQKVLYIFSDSMLLIRSMTEWIENWQKNNWYKPNGDAVLNQDILRQLIQAQRTRRIIWRHVKAHTGKKDWKSKWNDIADRQAKQAALS
jgi:ribonuclease HI